MRGSGQEVSAAPGPAAGNQQSSQSGLKKAVLCVWLAQEALKQIIQKILDELLNPAITA